jgi:hypothetical protein
MKLMLKVAAACSTLKQKLQSGHLDLLEMDILETQTRYLDEELQVWHLKRSLDWICLTEPVTFVNKPGWQVELLQLPGAPKVLYKYTDPLKALDMNISRATRLHLILTRLECLHQPAGRQFEERKVIPQMVSIIEDICATIPETLQMTSSSGDAPQYTHDIRGQRGHHLLFPLLICGRCFQLAEARNRDVAGRRTWIEAVAAFVSRELGYAVIPLKP